MRFLVPIFAAGLFLTLAAALYFRMVPMLAETWHVDPAVVDPPASPNFELRQGDTAPVLGGSPADVAARLETVALSDGATRIAGDLVDGHATYVVRSRLMGYPDAISIRLTPEGEGTRVEIFSRSRFGYSDMGVNAARVARWMASAAP